MILDTPADWRPWLQQTKKAAQGPDGDIWVYLDPSKSAAEVKQPPIEPETVTARQFNPGGAPEFTPQQLACYQVARNEYKDELVGVERVRRVLTRVFQQIEATVAKKNHIYLRGKSTPHEALLSLQSALSPTREVEERRIVDEYRSLLKYNKRERIEAWLQRWENIYADAVELDLPDVQGTRPLFDFLSAIAYYNEVYATTANNQLRIDLENGKPPTIQRLIERFRQEVAQLSQKSCSHDTHLAFATEGNTYKGDSPSGEEQQSNSGNSGNSSSNKKKRCICGFRSHPPAKCYYLNSSIRPEGFALREETRKKNDKALADPKVKGPIEAALKKENVSLNDRYSEKKTGESIVAATHHVAAAHYVATTHHVATVGAKEGLYHCWTLDGASDVHVVNHKEGFTHQRKACPGKTMRGGTQILK